MRGFLSLLLLMGLNHVNINSQPIYINECILDTILVSSDGSIRRIQYSTSVDYGFSHILRSFEEAQRQIFEQVNHENERLNVNKYSWQQRIDEERAIAKQQLKNQKIAIFTDIIGLTENEAQRFWPVYNKYNEEREKIIDNRQLISDKIRDPFLSMSNTEMEQISFAYVNNTKLEADLKHEYYKQFKTILPPNKLMLLYRAEIEFKIMLLRRFRGDN